MAWTSPQPANQCVATAEVVPRANDLVEDEEEEDPRDRLLRLLLKNLLADHRAAWQVEHDRAAEQWDSERSSVTCVKEHRDGRTSQSLSTA